MKKKSLPVGSTLLPIICIGIACTEKDYRLCYFLNRELDIELAKSSTELKFNRDNNTCKMMYFHALDLNSEYYLLENKTTTFSLLPDYKNINYWFIVKSRSFDPPDKSYSKKLNKLDVIVTTFVMKDEKDIKFLNDLILQ